VISGGWQRGHGRRGFQVRLQESRQVARLRRSVRSGVQGGETLRPTKTARMPECSSSS